MYIMFSKTMEFCNKGMVRADPLPWMALVIDDSPDNPSNQCILGLLDRTQCLTFI